MRNSCFTVEMQQFPLFWSESPQLDQVQESARLQEIRTSAGLSKRFLFSSSIQESRWTIGERFMVKEESAASVGTRPWTPEGRSLTLSIAFML
ncbi:hypothetical protein AVEN_233989-1 [Araneus ventricosus]|uniref:Uncharacterized protein n=1 Tax=Araneus ventricosus TaxID=182803 RepID=A0A4Y2MBK9_ARAVE|nr:hypothetical protein AVEN_233989-1 [Araneus ventricosus]